MRVYHLITLITLEILIYNSTLIVSSSLWSPIPSPPILTDTLSVDWLCNISSVLGNSNGCDGDDEDVAASGDVDEGVARLVTDGVGGDELAFGQADVALGADGDDEVLCDVWVG